MIKQLKGWERVGWTWCKKSGQMRAEISRLLNTRDRTGLIEWHVIAWRGNDRANPLVDEFTGINGLDDAVMLANEVL